MRYCRRNWLNVLYRVIGHDRHGMGARFVVVVGGGSSSSSSSMGNMGSMGSHPVSYFHTNQMVAPSPSISTDLNEQRLYKLKSIFETYDLDGNGYIDREELQNMLKKVCYMLMPICLHGFTRTHTYMYTYLKQRHPYHLNMHIRCWRKAPNLASVLMPFVNYFSH